MIESFTQQGFYCIVGTHLNRNTCIAAFKREQDAVDWLTNLDEPGTAPEGSAPYVIVSPPEHKRFDQPDVMLKAIVRSAGGKMSMSILRLCMPEDLIQLALQSDTVALESDVIQLLDSQPLEAAC